MCSETQPISGVIVKSFLLPFVVATTTYWLFKRYDERDSRKQYSRLGVAIINSLLEEVNTGLTLMKNSSSNPLPTKSWSGPSTIPDEVLLRIIAVARDRSAIAFKPEEIRIHCKNYFGHMAENWKTASEHGSVESLLNQGQYVQSAEGVKAMLEQCRTLLEENAERWFPK